MTAEAADKADRPAPGKVSWRTIADQLASRLRHHAYCLQHVDPEPDCPFCEDKAAYRAYLQAGGTVQRPAWHGCQTVDVRDLRKE